MSAIAEMETASEIAVYRHGKNRNFTHDEILEIGDRAMEAYDRGDEEEFRRIYLQMPLDPDVLEAFAFGYGKDAILECDFDLTEADLKFGKGWLDKYAKK